MLLAQFTPIQMLSLAVTFIAYRTVVTPEHVKLNVSVEQCAQECMHIGMYGPMQPCLRVQLNALMGTECGKLRKFYNTHLPYDVMLQIHACG